MRVIGRVCERPRYTACLLSAAAEPDAPGLRAVPSRWRVGLEDRRRPTGTEYAPHHGWPETRFPEAPALVNSPSRSETFRTVFGAVRPAAAGLLVVLVAVTAWSYWPVLAEMAGKWSADPQYSHAYLVPLFSLYLLWSRRAAPASVSSGPSWGSTYA